MRLFAKSRLAVSVASVAIAAAVLLTGCGGDDGGSTGGGSTGGGNTGTTEPEPDPEPTPDPDPEPTPDPVDPDPVETTPEQKVVDVNKPVETNDGITMGVTTGSGESKKVETVAAPNKMVYAPFNFNITNNSEKDIDLQENTQTMAMKARSLVSTISADANYDALFDGSHTAKNFDISLDGTKVDAENTASVIEVYDENGDKQDGTILKPGWKAIIKVVVKVPEAWSQEGSPLNQQPINVTYNLPSENVTDKEVYVFAVTPSGTPKQNYTSIPTIVPTEDGTYYDYQTIEATLNGEDGELVIFKTTAKNTTKNVFHVRNTVSSLGNVTLDAEDGLKADRIFKGTKVEKVTCESVTTDSDTESRTVITALDADHEGMYVGESGNVYAYVFVPASSGKWTRLDFYFNGVRIGYAERTVEPTPDPDPDPDPDPTPDPDKPSATSLKFTKWPEPVEAFNLNQMDLSGYGVEQGVVIENVSDKAIKLDGVYTYEEFEAVVDELTSHYQSDCEAEAEAARKRILAEAGLSENDVIPEDVQKKIYDAQNEIELKYYKMMAKEAYQVAQKYINKNVTVMTSNGCDAWCITYLSELNEDHPTTTLQPGERVLVNVMVYSAEKTNLLGMYYSKQLFKFEQSVLEKADQEEPDEPSKDDWYEEKDADDGQVYTKLPTYFLLVGGGGYQGGYSEDGSLLIQKMNFSAEGDIRNTTADTIDLEHTFYEFATDGYLDEDKMFPAGNRYRYASSRYVMRVTMKSGQVLTVPCVMTVKASTTKLAPGAAAQIEFRAVYDVTDPVKNDNWIKMEVYDTAGKPDLCLYRLKNRNYEKPDTQSSKVRVQSLPNEIKTPVTQ